MEITNYLLSGGIKRILSLLNRDFFSDNVGSFDKDYWHYKKKAFPNGMMQNYVYSLAICHRFLKINNLNTEISDIIPEKSLISYILHGVDNTFKIQHRNGSFDEHYHNERSLVATSFVLISILNTNKIIKEQNIAKKHLDKIKNQVKWLLKSKEPVVISNHAASVSLGLILAYKLIPEIKTLEGFVKKTRFLLELQTEEGWFPEYDGCDPGYLTLTLDFLTQIYKELIDLDNSELKSEISALEVDLKESIIGVVEFLSKILILDGSFSGYLGSRKTNHLFISGFVQLLKFSNIDPSFKEIAKKAETFITFFFNGIDENKIEIIDDDQFLFFQFNDIFSHFNFLLENKYLEKTLEETESLEESKELVIDYYAESMLLIFRSGNRKFISSFIKGINFRLFGLNKEGEDYYIDTGISIELNNRKFYHSLVLSRREVEILDKSTDFHKKISISGYMQRYKNRVLKPFTNKLLIIGGMTFLKIGFLNRIFKKRAIKKLVSNKGKGKFRYKRVYEFLDNSEISITDILTIPNKSVKKIKDFYLTHGLNPYYVPSGEYYLRAQYRSPEKLSLNDLSKEEKLNETIFTYKRLF